MHASVHKCSAWESVSVLSRVPVHIWFATSPYGGGSTLVLILYRKFITFCEVSRDFCGLKRVCWDKDYLLFIIPNTFVRTFWSWEQCVIRGSCIAGTLPESMQIIFQIWKEVMGPSKHFSFSQLCQMGQWKLLLFPIKQSTGRFPNLLIKTHCKLTEQARRKGR